MAEAKTIKVYAGIFFGISVLAAFIVGIVVCSEFQGGYGVLIMFGIWAAGVFVPLFLFSILRGFAILIENSELTRRDVEEIRGLINKSNNSYNNGGTYNYASTPTPMPTPTPNNVAASTPNNVKQESTFANGSDAALYRPVDTSAPISPYADPQGSTFAKNDIFNDGKWRCAKCGRINLSYESTCSCGQAKVL